uniref:(northern house mosquito) hypothetical protein n=1 Tax=Culex pipiens TaxID=7175 RepID=A0A8D8ASN5_CULPI
MRFFTLTTHFFFLPEGGEGMGRFSLGFFFTHTHTRLEEREKKKKERHREKERERKRPQNEQGGKVEKEENTRRKKSEQDYTSKTGGRTGKFDENFPKNCNFFFFEKISRG